MTAEAMATIRRLWSELDGDEIAAIGSAAFGYKLRQMDDADAEEDLATLVRRVNPEPDDRGVPNLTAEEAEIVRQYVAMFPPWTRCGLTGSRCWRSSASSFGHCESYDCDNGQVGQSTVAISEIADRPVLPSIVGGPEPVPVPDPVANSR